MKYRKKEIAVIVIFAIFIGSAYLFWPFLKNRLEGEGTENRRLAEFPVFSWKTVSSYPSQIEMYINDHLPFRSRMVELNSMIDYYLLNTSSSSRVVKGKDDWLFYNDVRDGDPMSDYTGRKLYSEKDLRTIARNMEMTKDNLEAQGTKFVLLIAPNRERVYSEYIPSYYGKPAKENILKQVVDYLRENTDVIVLNPYDALMEYKSKHPDCILYRKTDTHWNDLGGFIATQELLDAVGKRFDENVMSINGRDDTPGDMADMLNLRNVIETGRTYFVTGFEHKNTTVVGKEDFHAHFEYKSPDAVNGSILVNRDSFTSAMRPFIKEAFKHSDMLHRHSFTNGVVEQEKPNVYVLELVERYMDTLLSYSYNNLSFEENINKYLDKLIAAEGRYVVLISVKDEASNALTTELMDRLQALGVQTDLIGKYRNSFYSVMDGSSVIAEDIGTSLLGRQGRLTDGQTYSVTSVGYDCGNTSSIVINGVEYSKKGRGLNIVVYDKKYKCVIDSVAFDTCDGLGASR